MTDNVFEQETNNQTPPATPEPQSNPFADQLSAITNENGEPKYKTVEDALSALNHSQQHIKTIESERASDKDRIAQLESELNTRKSVEQVVQDLTNPQSQNQTPTADPLGEDKGLNEDKVLELVNQALSQNQATQSRQSNVDNVVKTLSETYGDSTREVVTSRAKELGTTPSALQELAGQNPQLVLSLFNDVKAQNTAPTKSSTVPPTNPPKTNSLPKLERGIMQGATNEEVMDAWGKIKDYTYENLGVET